VLPEKDASGACERIRKLLGQGAPWDACDAFREALPRHPADAALLYCGALAHARAGSTQQAQALLDTALQAASADLGLRVEIMSLRGRLWKDRLHRTRDAAAMIDFAQRARAEYLAAYALHRDPFPGINAAALAMMVGDADGARALAADILVALGARQGSRDSWAAATAGEACLLLGRTDEALAHYGEAFARAPGDAGSVASMRRQLHMLARVLPAASGVLGALPAPSVVAFVGLPVDDPARAKARFPAALEPEVRAALATQLAALREPLAVFSSAAQGSDIVFIEEALARGAEVNVVLPFDPAEFVEARVAGAGADWTARFHAALSRATRVILATEESYLGDDVLFDQAVRLVEGLASLRAAQLETTVTPLAIADRPDIGEPDPTAETLARWRGFWGEPRTVMLDALRATTLTAAVVRPSPAPTEARLPLAPAVVDLPAVPGQAERALVRPRRTLKTLLFADIAGFGALHDAFAPLFHARFLNIVDEQLRACPVPALEANTWGDALYVVFGAPEQGAEFSLALLSRMLQVDWRAAGLSDSSQIRIALHAGPVFCGFDPIIGRDNYFGSSVTKTARMEPVTPPGVVYASEAFAASLACAGQDRYAFEYMGWLALAKGYGESRIYRLERSGTSLP
jgi:tetratricopeptide (TPR) repeat protein